MDGALYSKEKPRRTIDSAGKKMTPIVRSHSDREVREVIRTKREQRMENTSSTLEMMKAMTVHSDFKNFVKEIRRPVLLEQRTDNNQEVKELLIGGKTKTRKIVVSATKVHKVLKEVVVRSQTQKVDLVHLIREMEQGNEVIVKMVDGQEVKICMMIIHLMNSIIFQ